MNRKLYFVTARLGWDTVYGGHWLADSPKAAIEIAQNDIKTNDTGVGLNSLEGLEFKARASKADPASMAMNYR